MSLVSKYNQTSEQSRLCIWDSDCLEAAHAAAAKEEFEMTGKNSSVRKSRWMKWFCQHHFGF